MDSSHGPPSLTITNIPKDASEIEIAQFFGKIKIKVSVFFWQLKHIDLQRVAQEDDPFDEKFNWCYVELENHEDVQMALLLSG